MTRIKSSNVQIGNNFVLPIEKQEAPEVLKLKGKVEVLEKEIEQFEQKKQELINEGQKKAEELINEAKAKIENENNAIAKKREEDQKTFNENLMQEAEKIKAEAYQTGYDDGYKQGYVVITNELENKVHAVDDFVKAQFDLKHNIIKSSELDIVNLVIEIAKKICTKSIELNPELIQILTENAIKELKDKENITIIINPKLMDAVNSVSERLKNEIPQLQNIKILEDNSISADGTIVESLLTRVDSRVKSQINEIADKLFEAYHSSEEEIENYIDLLEESDIDLIGQIELSDDANITAFLNELEDIPSYDDKIREEDAEYYQNLNIDELKSAEPEINENKKENEINIDDINFDEFEEMFSTEENNNTEIVEQNTSETIVEPVNDNIEVAENFETNSEKVLNNDIDSIIENMDLSAKDKEKENNLPKTDDITGEGNV